MRIERDSYMLKRVLVAHGDDDYLAQLVEHLMINEIEVVGPANSAAMALALAAVHPVERAFVGRNLAGRRNGEELARVLRRDWGVRTTLIDTPGMGSLML